MTSKNGSITKLKGLKKTHKDVPEVNETKGPDQRPVAMAKRSLNRAFQKMVSARIKKIVIVEVIKPKMNDDPSRASDEMPRYVMNTKRANGMPRDHPVFRADVPTYVPVNLMSFLTQYTIKHPARY